MEKQTSTHYETVYHVDWKSENDATIWRANFLCYESYLQFVSQDSVIVVKEDYRHI